MLDRVSALDFQDSSRTVGDRVAPRDNIPGKRFAGTPRLKETVRRLASPLAGKLADLVIRAGRRGSVAIFAAHGVHTPSMCNGVKPPPSSNGIEEFEKALSAIKRHFTIVPMDEAVEMLSGKIPVKAACAVLTFDDSLKCMAEIVAPLLASMDLTATFFLSTDTIQTQQPYWWLRLDYAILHAQIKSFEVELSTGQRLLLESADPASARKLKQALRGLTKSERERVISEVENRAGMILSSANGAYPFAAPLTWEGVTELLRLGMSFGSHTVSHADLLALSEPQLARELKDSKRIIEESSGSRCRYFCYPYGSHSGATSEIVASSGYEAAFTTIAPGWNRPGGDMFSLRRSYVPRDSAKVPYLLCNLG